MSKYLIVGVVAILIITGASWYFNQWNMSLPPETVGTSTTSENSNAGTQTSKETPTTPATTRESIKVGDRVGDLMVTNIKAIALPSGNPKKDLRISFSGETVVVGTYAIGGFFGADVVSLNLSKADNPQFAYFLVDPDASEAIIDLGDSTAAHQALAANPGKTSVKIKNLSAAWATDTEAVTTAELATLAQ